LIFRVISIYVFWQTGWGNVVFTKKGKVSDIT